MSLNTPYAIDGMAGFRIIFVGQNDYTSGTYSYYKHTTETINNNTYDVYLFSSNSQSFSDNDWYLLSKKVNQSDPTDVIYREHINTPGTGYNTIAKFKSAAFPITAAPLVGSMVSIDNDTITTNNKNQLQATPVSITSTASTTTLAVGSPATASVTDSGTSTSHVFNFAFGLPTGATGATGATPIITPSATAASVSGSANPTASVTKGGTDERPTLDFSFGIPSSSAIFSSSTVSGGNSLRSITIDGTSWNIAASGSGPTLAGNNTFTGSNTFEQQITALLGITSADRSTGESLNLDPTCINVEWYDGGTPSQSETRVMAGSITMSTTIAVCLYCEVI